MFTGSSAVAPSIVDAWTYICIATSAASAVQLQWPIGRPVCRYYNGSRVLTGNGIIRCNYGRQTPSNLHKLLKIITF